MAPEFHWQMTGWSVIMQLPGVTRNKMADCVSENISTSKSKIQIYNLTVQMLMIDLIV